MKFADPVRPGDSNTIRLSYSNLFYLRDYEYTHNIQTGYTYFGSWHYPRIAIQPNRWLRIEGGALLQKDFGDNRFDRAWPVFALQLQHRQFRFRFGVLEGNQSHGLSEPLLGYDKVIERPVEEGIQLLWKTKRLDADIWLDWERRQKELANYPEELTGGLSLNYTVNKPGSNWQIKIPVQVLIAHKGGQLDTNNSVVLSALNAASGLSAEWKNPDPKKWLNQFRGEILLMDYNLLQGGNVYPYDKGSGFLANLLLRTKGNAGLLLSYWKGENFIAAKGGKLFQSISSIPGRNYREPERELLFLNLLYEKELFPHFYMDARFSPYIDLKNGFAETSFLLLFSYRNSFHLGKLKK